MNDPITVRRHKIFGINGSILNCLHSIEKKDDTNCNIISYITGNFVILCNLDSGKQQFLHGAKEQYGVVAALAISNATNCLAIGSNPCGKVLSPTIALYNFNTMRKLRTIAQDESTFSSLAHISFNSDGSLILVIMKKANQNIWTLTCWDTVGGNMVVDVDLNENTGSKGFEATFHPKIEDLFCICGEKTHRFYRFHKSTGLRFINFTSLDSCLSNDETILSYAWLNGPNDSTILGTKNGRLILCEKSQFICSYQLAKNMVTFVAATPKGFLVGTKTDIRIFEYKKEFIKNSTANIDSFCDVFECLGTIGFECSSTASIAISRNREMAYMVFQGKNQLYSMKIGEGKHNIEPKRVTLCSGHNGNITGLDICICKPLLITLATDHTVRLWDYTKGEQIMTKTFHEDLFSVAFHPSGHHTLVGCSDKLRLMSVRLDDFRTIWEIAIKNCKLCRFSQGGQTFAAVQGSSILIFDFHRKVKLCELKAHNSRVHSLLWSMDDSSIISCDEDGATYSWIVESGHRVGEFMRKGPCLCCCAFTDEEKVWILDDGNINELTFPKLDFVRKVQYNGETSFDGPIEVSKQNSKVIFIGGNQKMHNMNVFDEMKGTSCEINIGMNTFVLRLTRDSRFIFAIDSACSSIHTFVIENKRIRRQSLITAEHDDSTSYNYRWNTSVLISGGDLEEKEDSIIDLKCKIDEVRTQFEYHLKLKEMTHCEDIKEISSSHSESINIEEKEVKLLQNTRDGTQSNRNKSLTNLDNDLQNEVQDFESGFQKYKLEAIEKYNKALIGKETEQANGEIQTRNLVEKYEKCYMEIESNSQEKFQTSLKKRIKLEHEKDNKEKELRTIMSQVEDDIDEEIQTMKVKYDEKLTNERHTTMRFTGDNGILKKKILVTRNEIENRKAKVQALTEREEERREHVKKCEKRILSQKQEIQMREEIIVSKEHIISDLKKTSQELEKFKNVLEFGLSQLTKQIEPREKEMLSTKKQMEGARKVLDHYSKTNLILENKIAEFKKASIKNQNTIAKKREKIDKEDSCSTYLIRELGECTELIQTPDALAVQMTKIKRQIPQNIKTKSNDEPKDTTYRDKSDQLSHEITELKREYKGLSLRNAKYSIAIIEENTALREKNESILKEMKQLTKSYDLKRNIVEKQRADLTATHRK